ncbi:MAG: hypothetical protein IPI66_03010 [Chitinophagaceae bacterium]|nr:hypothetical protein [Chitinophagaceae bacterium]MBL0055152.1 hypothetical protein [Chitinophagaceae bacterium]
MKKITLWASMAVLAALLIISCGGPAEKTENKQQKPDSVVAGTEKDSVVIPAAEKPQTVDERIREIKQWYAEAQKLGMKNCVVKTRVRKDGLPSMKLPYDQVVKTCKLNDVYELIQGDFKGHEWSYTVNIYKKKGKIFFVFNEGGEEAWSWEKRYYCDQNENLIRMLEWESNDETALTGPGKEVKIDSLKPKIQDNIQLYLKDIDFVLAKK